MLVRKKLFKLREEKEEEKKNRQNKKAASPLSGYEVKLRRASTLFPVSMMRMM